MSTYSQYRKNNDIVMHFKNMLKNNVSRMSRLNIDNTGAR